MTETRTQTVVTYSDDRTTLEPPMDGIRLTVGGGSWLGTFAKMAAALVNDILDDGEPVMGTVVTEATLDGQAYDGFMSCDGMIVSFTGNVVTFEDGVCVDADNLLSVTI